MVGLTCPSPLLAGMFPRHAATAEYRDFRGSVRPSEFDQSYVGKAGVKRREEFAAGRLCAAAALQSLGLDSVRVERAPSGAPIWPAGVLGSISHMDDVAVAVVVRSEHVIAIGVDVERAGAVEATLWPLLFSDTERRSLEQGGQAANNEIATALFAAKEAFYKAQWPLTQEWLDFSDVEIEFRGRTFAVRPCSQKAWIRCMGDQPEGVCEIREDIVSAAIVVPWPSVGHFRRRYQSAFGVAVDQ